ncbi:MAG TPA: alcohol dehydrogenase catalytic domain-containing protein [Bryobacterales bacterium]|nr:alcohol dehydrogenase catalytic domain-containing protein [Bryobacterales bacterium]
MNVKTEMMAAVLYGKEELRVEPVAIPRLGPSDVLVKVNVALTCGTDLKVFRRGYHARMIVPPAVLGHELAGDVVEVGSEVENFRVGQRVVASNSAPCGNCYYCARGQENLCEDLLFNNGAYAEYIRIPGPIVQRNMYEIPAHIGYQDAALIEPLACVLRGLDETQLRPGDTVAVIGLGPIGLMFVRLAKTVDARVIAVGRRKTQLDRAAKMGADELISTETTADVVEAVRRLTYRGRGADAAIEAVGQPDTWQWAVRMVRSGGVVNLFGGCPSGSEITLDTALLHYSEITLKSSFHHTPAHIRRALDAVVKRDIRAVDFVTGEAPLAEILDVLRHMMSRNGHLKTAILP